MPDAKPLQYRIVEHARRDADERGSVIAGLMGSPPAIAPKYFYDDLGCALYGAICRLAEYYPTRTEAAIFREHRMDIAAALPKAAQLIDLGAGDCAKAEQWLAVVEASRYIAVDIAAPELERGLARMAPDFPGVEMVGLVTDFSSGHIAVDDVADGRPAIFFYPGSSIGNFTPEDALRFVRGIREHCRARPRSALLIGVDAKKDSRILDAAYDDALGVTAAFNRNVLLHLNARFGFDFDIEGFAHRGFYNAALGRIEMHLEATRNQAIHLGGQVLRMGRGERIHTENSYKYHAAEFEALLREAGFADVRRWSGANDSFFVFRAA